MEIKQNIQISRNFTLYELLTTAQTDVAILTAQKNLNSEVFNNLERLVNIILQPARDTFKAPIIVTSGYRCPVLNTKIGGSKNSDHAYGRAADVTSDDNVKLFEILKKQGKFKQLIWYELEPKGKTSPQWIHVAYDQKDKRQEVLLCRIANGKKLYEVWND